MAVPTSIYKPQPVKSKYQSDVCFIGNAFPNRIEFFNAALPYLTNRKVVLIGALWDRLVHYKHFARDIQLNWMPLHETVNYYNGAKVVVNLHRPAVDSKYSKNALQIPGLSANPRTFEIAACGAFQLTDVRADLAAFYIPGTEIETYSSVHEFIEKVNYYLGLEQERIRIGARGLRRTLRDHLYPSRLHELLNVVFGRQYMQ
jgi:spore maturation protein CgeB